MDNSIPKQIESLGDWTNLIEESFRQIEEKKIIARIWNKEASLWKTEEAHKKIIDKSLGWLTVAQNVIHQTAELRSFANEIKEAGFKHVMLLGMGGSSLCPEVCRRSFERIEGYPELLVLDSTDPDTVADFEKRAGDLNRTLFIVASKSGSTVEPLSFYKYFFDRVQSLKGERAGENFIAITDPGTLMEQTAKEKRFRRIFLNPSDIGGRYSALSLFGMVPAALAGIDIDELLKRTNQTIEACGASVPVRENQAARLGTIMGAFAKQGRDKLTIISNHQIGSLGLWIEQLVAESTGKEGVGIVPVAEEPVGAPNSYGDDRLFVFITTNADKNNELNQKVTALEQAGYPVIRRSLESPIDLGSEFFVWELATAIAGAVLEIDPFDQPNVQESKDKTVALLREFTATGSLPSSQPSATEDSLSIYLSNSSQGKSSPTFSSLFNEHISSTKSGDYIAILAYLQEKSNYDELLAELRTKLRNRVKVATTAGYGPRYLHSTGQLHKGGADNGLFIIITDKDQTDLPVPGESYSFSILKQAQALGDFQALAEHKRRVIRIDVGEDTEAGLKRLIELIA
jgi:transaldolase / glucose-6-phosphate isomerase